MRLYPPAWGVPREAIEADDLQGHPVPKGAIITLAQFITHRHPEFWTEPDRFDPTRFLPAPAQTRHKCAYFPFGGGPRICIGNHLAMIEGAEQRGELKPGGTVVEYTGGSTGSSLAMVCAMKGYRAHFVSSDAFATEKLQTMRAFGAHLE